MVSGGAAGGVNEGKLVLPGGRLDYSPIAGWRRLELADGARMAVG
jgi:hypothetical protein